MHGRIIIAAVALAASMQACGSVEIRNPFAEHKPTALEASLAATQLAIDGAAEWYVDACVLRMPGIAIGADGCATYRDDVDPAIRGAHNTAIDVAESVDADDSPVGIALASVRAAQSTLTEYATRYSQDGKPWAQSLRRALTILEQRLSEVR